MHRTVKKHESNDMVDYFETLLKRRVKQGEAIGESLNGFTLVKEL